MKHKILIITPGFWPLFGGMEEQCYILSKEFLRQGYKVDILTEQTEVTFPEFEVIDEINIYRLRHIDKRNAYGFLRLFLQLVLFLKKKSREYDFCIIRTLTFHCMVVGFLKFLGLRLKTVVTAETGGKNDDVISLKKSKYWKILVFLAGRHNFYNAICDDNTKHYKTLGFNMSKVTKIYNGLEICNYSKASLPKKTDVFLFLGRILKTKGIFELVDAFKTVIKKRPEVKLLIGGDGLDKDLLLTKIKGVKNIKYLGFIERKDRENFYSKGDCLVLPSYSESFSMVVYEAAIRKKYVIATKVADLEKVFGKNILFCKKRDSEDLATKMLEIVDNIQKKKVDYSNIIELVNIKNIALKYKNLF